MQGARTGWIHCLCKGDTREEQNLGQLQLRVQLRSLRQILTSPLSHPGLPRGPINVWFSGRNNRDTRRWRLTDPGYLQCKAGDLLHLSLRKLLHQLTGEVPVKQIKYIFPKYTAVSHGLESNMSFDAVHGWNAKLWNSENWGMNPFPFTLLLSQQMDKAVTFWHLLIDIVARSKHSERKGTHTSTETQFQHL